MGNRKWGVERLTLEDEFQKMAKFVCTVSEVCVDSL